MLFDTHCHLSEAADFDDNDNDRDRIGVVHTVSHFALMSTNENNWRTTRAFGDINRQRLLVGYGVHPWFAESVSSQWCSSLEAALRADPRAFCGECGLDKVAKNRATGLLYDFDAQLRVFRAQFDLASRLQRPLSLHCVQAHGAMLDELRARNNDAAAAAALPPAIALHSFSGKPPLVSAYLATGKAMRERLYFGFSFVVNARTEQRTIEAIQV